MRPQTLRDVGEDELTRFRRSQNVTFLTLPKYGNSCTGQVSPLESMACFSPEKRNRTARRYVAVPIPMVPNGVVLDYYLVTM